MLLKRSGLKRSTTRHMLPSNLEKVKAKNGNAVQVCHTSVDRLQNGISAISQTESRVANFKWNTRARTMNVPRKDKEIDPP